MQVCAHVVVRPIRTWESEAAMNSLLRCSWGWPDQVIAESSFGLSRDRPSRPGTAAETPLKQRRLIPVPSDKPYASEQRRLASAWACRTATRLSFLSSCGLPRACISLPDQECMTCQLLVVKSQLTIISSHDPRRSGKAGLLPVQGTGKAVAFYVVSNYRLLMPTVRPSSAWNCQGCSTG